ncbi:MAG: hypothetical protein KJZ53_01895 [Anaerolineales bacterium]|nr:hypothetical protein [Anaerolineales bacterium]
MAPGIKSLKAYVPAKDLELSKRFYTALGFTMTPGWGGTADFELNGFEFRLQDHYVKDWAENFMFVIEVEDVQAWYQLAQELQAQPEFRKAMRITPPQIVDGRFNVLHVVDPAGVLLIFVQ